MKKFTKKQRHEIYVNAFNFFVDDNRRKYMCETIDDSIFNLHGFDPDIAENPNAVYLPEFYNLKPHDKGFRAPWFDIGREERIKKFKQIIEETK